MILLDANIFLHALTRSTDPSIQPMYEWASDLFRRAEGGGIEVTASDAVIAEVAFILTSKAHYRLAVDDAAGRLTALMRVRGVKLRDKRIILHALELWPTYPKLGFVDALTAAQARQPGFELATFDSDFDDLPGITRWRFDALETDGPSTS
jgi:predicted nucleic acid-binding protein